MGVFVGMIGFYGFIAFLIVLIINLVKKQPKKIAIIGITSCFALFCIGAALTPATADTEVSKSKVEESNVEQEADNEKAEEIKAEENKGEAKAEKVNEKIITYVNSVGYQKILYLATVKNTDNVPLQFGEVTIDINDENGNLIEHVDYGSVYPRYIMPGEYGYICEESTSFNGDINLDNIIGAEIHFDTRRAVNYKKPDIELMQLELKKDAYFWNILGKVKSNEYIERLSIVLPVFDADGELQTVAFTSIEGLFAGDERGFDSSLIMNCDPNTDFSTSKVEAIPYVY